MPPIEHRDPVPADVQVLFHPDHSTMPEPGGRRDLAIQRVIQCIPQDDYQKLPKGSCYLLAPPSTLDGRVCQFPPTHYPREGAKFARVVYLSPQLERRAYDVVVAVVAHELAHVVMHHRSLLRRIDDEAQEAEAWAKVREWGFELHARKCLAQMKRYGTLQGRHVMGGMGTHRPHGW